MTRFSSVFITLLCVTILVSVCAACRSSTPNAATESLAGDVSSTGNSIVDEKLQSSNIGSIVSMETSSGNDGKNQVQEELAYIKSFDVNTGKVTFDPIEWITKEDTARIKELGLNAEDDFPSGFHINNPSEQTESLKLSENCKIYIILWNDVGVAVEDKLTNKEGLDIRLKEDDAWSYPYELTIKDQQIIKMKEQYVP